MIGEWNQKARYLVLKLTTCCRIKCDNNKEISQIFHFAEISTFIFLFSLISTFVVNDIKNAFPQVWNSQFLLFQKSERINISLWNNSLITAQYPTIARNGILRYPVNSTVKATNAPSGVTNCQLIRISAVFETTVYAIVEVVGYGCGCQKCVDLSRGYPSRISGNIIILYISSLHVLDKLIGEHGHSGL